MPFKVFFFFSAFVFSTVSAVYSAEDSTGCYPPCRSGYLCLSGRCVEQCNPPCPANQHCTEKGDCVPNDQPASPVFNKQHKHTGFYLAFNGGGAFGTNSTSGFPASSGVREFAFNGGGFQFSFSIGAAVSQDLLLFADIPVVAALSAPTIKINGQTLSSGGNNLEIDNYIIGCGIMYYFMPYNFLVSASIGPAFATVSNQNYQSSSSSNKIYASKTGFGFRLRAGKEWWVSNRWALGAVGFYQYTTHGSGDFFPVDGSMYSSTGGVSFSATFN